MTTWASLVLTAAIVCISYGIAQFQAAGVREWGSTIWASLGAVGTFLAVDLLSRSRH